MKSCNVSEAITFVVQVAIDYECGIIYGIKVNVKVMYIFDDQHIFVISTTKITIPIKQQVMYGPSIVIFTFDLNQF